MFDNTSRSVYENGLRFYEEDILFDSHIYHANQIVHLELSYVKNGVGLIIGLLPGQPLEKQDLYYFLRLDAYSASLFLVNQMHYERLEHVSTPICAPLDELKIDMQITPNQIVLALNDRKFMYADLNYAIGDHHLGIYSQKDNTFTKMFVEGRTPLIWRTNMHAAENGRITFKDNQVTFSDCKYPAEMTQEAITLTEGDYYLQYEGENVKVYLYDLRSPFVKLEDKNLILEDNRIHIKEECQVALYIASDNGYIKNVSLSSIPNAPYIETYLDPTLKNESYFKVKLKEIKSFIIEFNILRECFGVLIEDDLQKYEKGFIEGDHKLVYENNILYLYYKGQYLDESECYGDILYLLKGVEAFIYNIRIVKKNGQVEDWFQKVDKSDWLKPSLNSPILAVDIHNAPLDLSASFRKVKDRYIFSNIERESFKPEAILRLEKPIHSLVGVYGIPKTAITHDDKFYEGQPENPNDITSYCKTYVAINNASFDEYLNQVTIYEPLYTYKEIIIDYKKQDSYAINFVTELGKYSVQTTASYCSYFYSEDGQEQYVPTSYKEEENRYIVLEKGEFYED